MKERISTRFLLLVGFGMALFMATSCDHSDEQQEETNETTTPEEEVTIGVVYNGTSYAVGDTIYGYNNYIELIVGDSTCPLLLGVPHDGVNAGVPEIPETGTTGRDIYTKPLAAIIASSFKEETGLQPWIIINEISRKRVDPNTYPDDVADRYTDEDAVNTYNSYHTLLAFARSVVASAQVDGKGALFLDVHGHAHTYTDDHKEAYTSVTTGSSVESNYIDQSEIGYGLTNASLEEEDSYLDTLSLKASIYAIANSNSSVAFSTLIRGEHSFGSLLEDEGVHAVPSDELPKLDRNANLFGTGTDGVANRRPYYNGGYCTRHYGTIVKGSTTGYDDNISSIQIETPGITVRNNKAIRAVAGPRIKRALINYLNYWYGYSFSNDL